MRAILIKDDKGPLENLYIGNVETPTPGERQLLVKVKAFGLNSMDILQREGKYPLPPGAPTILGVEFSGHIAALGPNVSNTWKEGDQVFGIAPGGAYAEYILAQESHLIPKPSHLSWTEAASIPEVFLTALQGITLYGSLQPGESVLIHAAASSVGIAAIQMARSLGAKNVIATASTKEKLDWLLSIPNGATHGVNYKTHDFAAEALKITHGKGVDVILDFVGQTHWKGNIDSLAVDGRMTIFALLSGYTIPSVDLRPFLYKRLRIQGSTLRSRSMEYQADLIARLRDQVLGNVTGSEGNGPIKTYIHKVYDWNNIQEAHREMEENKNIGKIIVEIA
ncbi:related to NADPH quinone oxidoreductase homolog PIG3 [Armillaria ostoyae]|uniref:Related to NADPH quinone oxidoreductase homolog PIG3 n=1 Tax=Armillaria ostoyae TaxID=47428 RepID=A0A284R3X7_ARMOS|nr:related to NADPH quinone oxidoreductase homolog PIG3 [Armillaria ostoyae]